MGEWSAGARSSGAVAPWAVWQRLIDGRRWHEWNLGTAWAAFESGAVPGGYLTVKPARGPQTAFRILEADAPHVLAFETRFGPLGALAFRYTIAAKGDASDVAVRLVITGIASRWIVHAAGRRLAPSLAANLERLLDRARAG